MDVEGEGGGRGGKTVVDNGGGKKKAEEKKKKTFCAFFRGSSITYRTSYNQRDMR